MLQKMLLRKKLITALFGLFLCVDCQSEDTDYYGLSARYDCTQNCSTAEGTPRSNVEYPHDLTQNFLCRCDRDCRIYGDCCTNVCNEAEQNAVNPLDGLLQCGSIHLDVRTKPDWMESFWMVSACPADWLAGSDDQLFLDTFNNCTRGSRNLPPVTALNSGLVYKNEYCAVCHEVETFQMWGYHFECTPSLNYSMIKSPDFQLTIEIIEQECIACGFYAPQSIPSARACVHDSLVNDSCLGREELQDMTGVPIEEEDYQDIVRQCQSGPICPVSLSRFPTEGNDAVPFRNQYCAICNAIHVATEKLMCINPYSYANLTNQCREEAANLRPMSTIPTENDTEAGNDIAASVILPFTVFLDVNGDSQIVRTQTVTVTIPTSCSNGQVFDPIDQICRTTICPESAHGGSCAIVKNITLGKNSNNSLLCDGVPIPLNKSDFQLLDDNKTLLFHDEVFNILGYINNLPIICTNYSENGTLDRNITLYFYSYPAVFSILTYVGCSLSIIGCIFVLLTYTLFSELRTLPGKILMNLSATILATCIFTVIGIPLFSLAEKEELCQTTAIVMHWLVLCEFSWMMIMSYELTRTLIRATQLKPVQTKNAKRHILLVYMLIGWGSPTVITGVCVIVNYTTDYIRYGREGFCWIEHMNSMYTVFIAPVAILIILNGITFSITSYLLFRAWRSQAKLHKQNSTSYFRIYLSVFSVTGLTWIFGFVAILSRGDWAWYLFIIFTSTQGFTNCVAFLFTQKVASLYKGIICPKISVKLHFPKGTMKQSTQNATMTTRYSRNSENVSKVLSDCTWSNGNELETGPTHSTILKKHKVEEC